MTKPHEPKVSVIMPAYNSEGLIKKSIDSILAQTLKDFELIIIDDGSTDKTSDVVKRYSDRRIVYLKNKKNLGVPKARNAGLKKAGGEYIAYCDHDDIYYKDHLESLAYVLDTRSDVGLVYADYFNIGYKGHKSIFKNDFRKEDLEIKNIIGAPFNVMHRIKCVKRVGGFNESFTIKTHDCEDYELWLRIADHFKCFHLNKVLGKFIYHRDNRSFSMDFSLSYKYITKKRWKKRMVRSQKVDYINYCGARVMTRLIGTGTLEYASHLAQTFRGIVKNYQTRACLGLCSIGRGDFKKAVNLFKKSLEELPADWQKAKARHLENIKIIKFYLMRGLYHLGELSQAMKICRELSKLAPENSELKILMAKCHVSRNHYDKAFNLVKNTDDFRDAYLVRGYCYLKRGRYGNAISEFKKAARLNLGAALYLRNIICAYIMMGKYKSAITTYIKLFRGTEKKGLSHPNYAYQ